MRNARDRSGSSTEVSENEHESAGLSLKATAFILKTKDQSPMVKLHGDNKASSALMQKLEVSQFGTNSETHPKKYNGEKFTSGRVGAFSQTGDIDSCQERSFRKHNRKFNNRDDKDKYIESYKKKKKTKKP